MKVFMRSLTLVCLLTCSYAYAQPTQNENSYALIYNGVSTCDGCPEAMGELAKKNNMRIKYVSNPKEIPNLLEHALIFMIGGTHDNIEPMRIAFDKNIVKAIKAYLHRGGKYLGICGGAFIASDYYYADVNKRVPGFGIIPATAVDYSDSSDPHLETITWNGKPTIMYFQGGPTFELNKSAKNITVFARYDNGDIAGLTFPYGKGKVIAIGPHPEADLTWIREDKLDATKWQPSQQLALDLIK